MDYNLIAIGGGSAGLVTSYIGASTRAKVALIEKHKMGGDCLNTGCVPSKALIKSAKVVATLKKHSIYGLENVSYDVNFAKAMDAVQDVIKKIEPHDSVERYTGLGVNCYQGEAQILSAHEVKVGDEILTTKNIVVATGARPFVPPIPGLDQIHYLHSDNLWELREQPKQLLVIGGGPIGCELAQAFSRLGSQVTIMDMAPTIMPREDPDVAEYVIRRFQEEGIALKTGVQIKRFERSDSGGQVVYEEEGSEKQLSFDQVLIATGRKANTEGFGLKELGVELNPNGTIKVDSYLRSNIPSLFACGDVAGPYQFTHTAAHQAWFCSVNALFGSIKKFAVDYSVIPWCTYTDPEVARVGLSETEARAQNIPYEVTTYGLDDLDRAITEREDYGIVKVLTPPKSDKILGVTICGYHAGDLIAEYVLAMKHGLGLNKILGTIHIYPTMAEANKYAAGMWRKANAPEKVLAFLEKFHAWRRS